VVALLSLAAAAHQAWSANMFTLASDMFPRRAVASVVGIGTFGAALLMAFISTLVGYVLRWTNGDYAPLFVVRAPDISWLFRSSSFSLRNWRW
jgi:MFS transporter, ACS family, aldohexuronate transporter